MISLKLCRTTLIRLFVILVIISSLMVPPGFCLETEDSQIFMAGFNAYQQKNYTTAVKKMNEVLQKYPDSPLRDMAIFWLARSYYKSGDLRDAARYMSQFAKEYPDNPLRGTVEDELLALTARYEKGEALTTGPAAAGQPAPEQQAAEKPAEKASAEKVAAEKVATEKAAAEKVAAEKAAAEKAAAEKVAAEKAVAAKAEQERLAQQKAAAEKVAAEKALAEKAAAEKAAAEKVAAEKAEQGRLAQLKVAQEKAATEQTAQEQQAKTKAEQERLAAEKAAAEKTAAEKAEQGRLAQLKVAQEKAAAEQAAQEQQARQQAAKAEQERLAAEKAIAEKAAAEKVEQERLAQLKATQEKVVQEKQAAEQAESLRLAREKAALKQKETEQAEQGRLAQLKAAEEKTAAEKVAAEKAATEKADQERLAKAKGEQERLAAEKTEQQRLAQLQAMQEKAAAEKAALREKAIAQYKSIIESYPGSKAATTAAAKLKELGIAVALPPAQPAPVERLENAQVLKFEVAQYAGFEFNLMAQPKAYEVAQRVSIPFELTNRGNGTDSFTLASSFPAEFKAGFAAVDAPETAISQTPKMAPGAVFKGIVTLEIPADSIDGRKVAYPVKAASMFMAEATQSREVAMTASAPLLRAVLKSDKAHLLPGEKVFYRAAVLNIGSATAKNVSFRLNFPQQLEPLDLATAGLKQEAAATSTAPVLVAEGLQIKSGETREFIITFQLKDDSLAGQQLFARVDLDNVQLKTRASFISSAALVDPQHGIRVRTASERLVVIPGQTTTVPFVVTNTGNVNERFKIASSLKTASEATFFLDINRDGIRQENEPLITELGPLAPKEEASIVMEVKTPRNVSDRTEDNALVTFTPEGDVARAASATAHLVYSRPELKMAVSARDGRLTPGEVATFDLTLTNSGSNIARVVELHSAWPEQLELVGAEPVNSSNTNGTILWRFKEVGAGEKKTIKVSFRVKYGTGVGTNIQVRNILTYEDQMGNRY